MIPELRHAVRFFQQNLLHNHYKVQEGVDIIFCRNVMIYFDKPTQEVILKRMLALLKPNGWYIAGHSENFSHLTHLMRPMGKTIYQVV